MSEQTTSEATPAGGAGPRRLAGRTIAFVLITLASSAFAIGYVALHSRAVPAVPAPAAAPAASASAAASTPLAIARKPHVLFRAVGTQQDFGKVSLAPLDAPAGARAATSLSCVRVHFSAGNGLCLEASTAADLREVTLRTFGATLEGRWKHSLSGIPSRARVSPDGRRGAVTIFVVGHSYADAEMSTQTLLVDLDDDAILVDDLEKLALWHDGARLEARDVNYWGVTFTRDSNRFYATASSGGDLWLVAGDIAARRMETVRENVECPALSPDGKLIAFKKRMTTPGTWRLHVLDLAAGTERILAGETRFIDDQVEWLDDGHILYKLGPNVYELAVGDSAAPRVFLSQASSPAIVRPSPG